MLEEIQQRLPAFPVVLHGASSVDENTIKEINELGGQIKQAKGVPADMLHLACTKYNVCKINVDTDIRMATTLALRKYFSDLPDNVDTKKYFGVAQESIKALVSYKICEVFNSNNKA